MSSMSDPRGKWAKKALADLEAGLKAFGPVKPRRVESFQSLPHRGVGTQPDGRVTLAVTDRWVFVKEGLPEAGGPGRPGGAAGQEPAAAGGAGVRGVAPVPGRGHQPAGVAGAAGRPGAGAGARAPVRSPLRGCEGGDVL